MSQFLDLLKNRLADSQQRLQAAQAKLQQAQIEHQAVMQEFTSWQNAVAVETRREQGNITVSITVNGASQPSRTVIAPGTNPAPIKSTTVQEVNKTSLIRDVLRQNPNGITPANLWRVVKDQVPRPYVYSVLKRLKDRKQVSDRRGKYVLVVEAKSEEEESKSENSIQ